LQYTREQIGRASSTRRLGWFWYSEMMGIYKNHR
jgi:hypothetical protein